MTVFSVSELTADIKLSLEDQFQDITVEGELSGFKRHSSGHCYFTLKDGGAQIRGVMFRWQAENLFFQPKDGMLVRARGNISVYEQRGDYQLLVRSMRPAGEGELARAFQELKIKLNKEGFFDPSHKKDIPRFPTKIGVITSRDGAAIKDIFSTIGRRYPQVELLFVPTPVQGPGAAETIAQAISVFNDQRDPNYQPEVIILTRGGGSVEDLWAFNEEIVARAVFDSEIPIICGVGHESDFSIAEFVADLRAATPTQCAEMATPDREELIGQMYAYQDVLKSTLLRKIENNRQRILHMRESRSFNRPINFLRESAMRLDRYEEQLNSLMHKQLTFVRHRIELLSHRINDLDPGLPMRKGFALVSFKDKILKTGEDLKSGDIVSIRFKKDSRDAEIK